ncbi:F-box associated ubiquitination effector family protein, partial [Striga hermonthica]
FRVEIPEFDGGVDGSEFIDWWASVEAALSFKEVPEERRVALVATRFRGRAAVWWMNVSSLRHRQGKQPLVSWTKFREVVEREFVPFNYDSIVYQQLQSLRQGTRSVTEYTTEFHRLLTRVDLRETKNQLVSRYVGGLRAGIRDMLNMFRPESISDAHQRALLVELQLGQRAGQFGSSSSRPGATSNPGSSFTRPGAAAVGGSGQGTAAVGGTQRVSGVAGQQPSSSATRTVAGLRCFGCGEIGHRHSVCPKGTSSRALFTEETGDVFSGDYDGPPVYDIEHAEVEELVPGDVGTALVLRRVCLAPRGASDSPVERHHLFESTCTVGDRVCRFIIDSGSCENVIAQEAVDKLQLATVPHPQPYTLAWIQRGNALTVDR